MRYRPDLEPLGDFLSIKKRTYNEESGKRREREREREICRLGIGKPMVMKLSARRKRKQAKTREEAASYFRANTIASDCLSRLFRRSGVYPVYRFIFSSRRRNAACILARRACSLENPSAWFPGFLRKSLLDHPRSAHVMHS